MMMFLDIGFINLKMKFLGLIFGKLHTPESNGIRAGKEFTKKVPNRIINISIL